MPLSPELRLIPGQVYKFTKAGLTFELVRDMVLGNNIRDLAKDSARLLKEFESGIDINLYGLENIPDAGLLTFNHPDNDILFPSVLTLMSEIKNKKGTDMLLVVAGEVMVSAKLNEKTSFPGSQKLIKRLHSLYPNNVISAPTVASRKDFVTGRAVAARKIMASLKNGRLVAISPEGHTEESDVVSPINTFHEGTGALARIAGKLGLPVIPVTIWGERTGKTKVNIRVSEPFIMNEKSDIEAVTEIMRRIAVTLPEHLKGPFMNEKGAT